VEIVTPRLALAMLALALPSAARAHGVSGEVERHGGAYAVRARYHGGAPLAGASYQLLRPGSPERVEREGRTGAQGWVEFVPDVAGTWRVRIVDASGHGRVIAVDVAEVAPPPPPPPASPVPVAVAPQPPPGAAQNRGATGPTGPTGPGALRIAAGALAIALAFLALRAVQRRRGAGR